MKLEGVVVVCKSGIQRTTTLLVTEIETVTVATYVQDIMFFKNNIESIGLDVELPMKPEIDNKGAVDMAHIFLGGGRIKHMKFLILWIREMMDKRILNIQSISGDDNESNI